MHVQYLFSRLLLIVQVIVIVCVEVEGLNATSEPGVELEAGCIPWPERKTAVDVFGYYCEDGLHSRILIGALQLGDFDIPHALEGHVGGGEGEGQHGRVAVLGTNIHVYWNYERNLHTHVAIRIVLFLYCAVHC